jgi:hypothetical protein
VALISALYLKNNEIPIFSYLFLKFLFPTLLQANFTSFNIFETAPLFSFGITGV